MEEINKAILEKLRTYPQEVAEFAIQAVILSQSEYASIERVAEQLKTFARDLIRDRMGETHDSA